MQPIFRELRGIWPAWAGCVAMSSPFILFWHSVNGRGYGLMVLLLGSTITVAASVRQFIARPLQFSEGDDAEAARRMWGEKMTSLVLALALASTLFSALCLIVNNPPPGERQAIWWRGNFREPRDLVAVILAFMAIVPALGITPYLVMATRKPFAAVVFTVSLVGCMKLLGALVVVFVYGWDAQERGYMRMPWNQPDLLVWLFWTFTAAVSLTLYILGARRFRAMCERRDQDGQACEAWWSAP